MSNLSFDSSGAHLGWAAFDGATLVGYGTVGLGCGRGSKKTPCRHCRWRPRAQFDLRTRVEVKDLFDRFEPQVVAYEKVVRHKGVATAHMYGAVVTNILAECQAAGVEHVHQVHPSTWKAHIGAKGGHDAYVDRVNLLTGLALPYEDEDTAAAIGIGMAVWVPRQDV